MHPYYFAHGRCWRCRAANIELSYGSGYQLVNGRGEIWP